MRPANYERIALRYDDNEVRKRISPDELVARAVQESEASPRVLDVGCGTGNWLEVQVAAHGDRVRWTGLEPSDAMRERARAKIGGAVTLVAGKAEALPFEDGAFDLVVSTFAFHHFTDKRRALEEMCRVLDRRPGRALRLRNIEPTRMPGWWGYRWFPETRLVDEERFWSPERVAHALEALGLEVHVRILVDQRRRPLAELVVEAERRDVSQLAVLDEAEHARGLRRLRDELAADPDARAHDETAIATWTATRS